MRGPPIAGDGAYRLIDFDGPGGAGPHARALEGIYLDEQVLFRSSADGRWLAGGGVLGRPFVWDAATGRKRAELGADAKYVHVLEFIDGGASLIASDVGSLRIWHLDRPPGPPAELEGHRGEAWDSLFTPDGKLLITAGDDHAIRIWDPDSGEELATLLGHGVLVTSIAISPDGRTLASGGFDDTVRLWDLTTRRPLAVLRGHTHDVLRVAFSVDGRTLASTGKDGTVRTWDVAERRAIATFPGRNVVITPWRSTPMAGAPGLGR
ncbi:MAG: WD40 repeat domain-containing protein [Isosphaeraceae bacterium]